MPRPRRWPLRRVAVLAAVAALPAAGAGCGADTEGPSDSDQVRAVVERFAVASRARDYQTICDDLLSADLVRGVETVGLPCESALQRGLAAVRDPRLEIREISVASGRALVSIHTTAIGQESSNDAMQLVREQDQWRISSLVEPGQGDDAATTTTTTPFTLPTEPVVPSPDHEDR